MTPDTKKPWFRDKFRDWVEGLLKEKFDRLNDAQRSKLMARFFAEQVLGPRDPALLPFAEEDLHACVVDGAGDIGIDFASREGGVVLIIQAKYSGGKKATKRPHETPADFEHFRTVLGRLMDYRDLEVISEPLREFAAEIDWDHDNFQLYYITLRQLAENQTQAAAAGIPIPTDYPDLEGRVALSIFDEAQLNIELRDALSTDQDEGKTFRLQFTENDGSKPWVCLADANSRPCYVGRISGAQLAVLFQEHKSGLFTLNIRNYIGDNSTNKTIRATALQNPGDFFSFNNGISALAARIGADESDPKVLICERFSVINGAQTIRSLHKAHVADPKALREVQVLLRVTEFHSKKKQPEQAFLDNVTKYNNTQNAIKLSDFRSNDKIQFDLRRKFEDLPSVHGKRFYYKNKRSGEPNRDKITIGMEEFVKTVYAFRFGPDDLFGGTSHVFDATKGGGYAKLFGDGVDILPSLSNETFELYAGIWFLCDTAKDIWSKRAKDAREPALERRWMFYFALGESLRVAYLDSGHDIELALRGLAKPAWIKEDESGAVKKALGRHCRVAFKALIDSYKEASKEPGFAHRNWFRQQSTPPSIREHLTSSWTLLADHADEYMLPKPK